MTRKVRSKQSKPKVVEIGPRATGHPRIIAADPRTHRYVIAIGRQRIAYDLTTTITRLSPGVGDGPAIILPMKSDEGR